MSEAHRRRLDALASLAVEIRGERTEQAILARLREELARHDLAAALLEVAGDVARIVWLSLPEEVAAALAERVGPAEGFRGAVSAGVRQALAEESAFTEDWPSDVAAFFSPELAAEARTVITGAGLTRGIRVRLQPAGDDEQVLVFGAGWLEPEDAPALRLFGGQVSAALQAARAIADLSRRNAHLDVLARVAALAGDATDLPTFFARASDSVRPVAGFTACALYVIDEAAGEFVRVHLDPGVPAALEEHGRRLPIAPPLLDVVRERRPRATAVPYEGGLPGFRDLLPYRSTAWVPLVARSRSVGVLAAGFEGGLEQAEASLDLLTAVGAHCASAIESHGLLANLRRRMEDVGRRLADLEAVHDLTLRVFANAPGDARALLQDACRELVRTLSATAAAVFVTADGSASLRLAAAVGLPARKGGIAIDLTADGLSAEVMRTRGALQTVDMTRDPRSQLFGRTDVPPLAVLAVPLVSRSDVRGVVYVADRAGRTFGPGEIAVANALAAALGLGVENAELYADARRRVEELSLLNEAGRDIASSLDLADVLRTASAAARRLVGASRAWVLLPDPGTGALRLAGGVGIEPHLEGITAQVEPGSFLETLLETHRAAVAEDVGASAVGAQDRALLAGRALAAVPVQLRGELLGVLVTDDVVGPRRFTEADLGRLTSVADRLAVAMENARLYLETRDRAEQLGLLHEVGRSLVETLDIEQILDRGIRNLARIVDAPDAYLCLASEDGATLEFRAMTAHHDRLRGYVLPTSPPEHNIAARVLASREPLVVVDGANDPRVRPELQAVSGGRAYLTLPLVVRDRAIGAVMIVETRGPRVFTPAEVERAAAIANQLAVAAENARLYEDLRRSYAQLARAQQQLVQGERLAALGELSAVVAHEVRNPLGVIFNSLGSLRRLVRPVGDAKMLLDIVQEESERLNRIVGDLLDFARPSTPDLRPELLGRVADDALSAVVIPQGVRVEIVRELDPALPPVPVDARLVRQAVLNVAVNAVQAMPRGGRLTVRARREGDEAVVELEDTGVGIPVEVRERIFEPFFTTKASGTGLGLAVVRRIVEGHGGVVRVRSEPGAGTAFSLRFPLAPAPVENEPAMR